MNQASFPVTINRMIPSVHGIYPDVHSKRLSDFFSDVPTEKELQGLRDSCRGTKVFFLCFTNRCGSNFVAQSLASDGTIKQPGENLNYNTVINHCRRRNLKSYTEYLTWLIQSQAGVARVFGVKCSVGQLIQLLNFKIIQQLDSPAFILVQRSNTLKQAISLSIASQTRQWTSTQATEDNRSVSLDSDLIFSLINSISTQNACFEAVFSLTNVNALRVDYEQFIIDPISHVPMIGQHIGIPSLQYIPASISYKKQANQINQQMYEIMIQEFSI
jgi:LPS sulfotransferase NodH